MLRVSLLASKTVKPIVTEHSTEWHWWAFADFCKKKAEVHEPSPHMQMIGTITEGKPIEEVIWFSCLYAAYYNIPSALVTWKEWPWERAKSYNMELWLKENWKGTFTRTERRAVRTVKNMNACMTSLAWWADHRVPKYLEISSDTHEDYDSIWQETEKNLAFMGRYIIIRLLEGLHRFADLKPKLYDIRSIGGWSPKRAMGLLYPEQIELLLSPDTKENIKKVDALAFSAMDRFAEEYDIPMSPYVFAAMLCEYRVAYENRKQYPGWTIDQEPAYWYKIMDYWVEHRGASWVGEVESQFFGAREKLFSPYCLGEVNGWVDGTRIEPRRVLRDYGYNWSDLEYDFKATTDFSNPVRR